MSDETTKCFRCGAQPKVLISMTVNEGVIKMCSQCFADFGRFLEGYAVDTCVVIKRGVRIRKEEEDD